MIKKLFENDKYVVTKYVDNEGYIFKHIDELLYADNEYIYIPSYSNDKIIVKKYFLKNFIYAVVGDGIIRYRSSIVDTCYYEQDEIKIDILKSAKRKQVEISSFCGLYKLKPIPPNYVDWSTSCNILIKKFSSIEKLRKDFLDSRFEKKYFEKL